MFQIDLERLYLRELTVNDFDSLFEILSDPETMKYYPAPYEKEGVKKWIEKSIESYKVNRFGLWAVILKSQNEFLGQCGISLQNINGKIVPEIGYHINKKYWKNGYATEAANGCLNYGFNNLKQNEIFIHTSVNNVPSYRIAEKIFMTKRFVYDKELKSNNTIMKHVVYSMDLQEYNLYSGA